MPTVQTNGLATYYEQRGSGPPVVFVHAAVLDHRQWAPQYEDLSDDYTTFAYDVRGHGRTGGSDLDTYSIDLFADDLAAFVDSLDITDPVVCGHSTGGCIAQVYAARRPDALDGLVLADTFTPELLSRGEWVQRSLMLRATVPPARLLGYERVERALVRIHELVSGEGASGDYASIARLRAAGQPMTTDEFAKVVRAVANFHETTVYHSAITVPTLVLYGEHVPAFLRRQASKLRADIPDATLRAVPGGGHASNLDNPAFVTRTVRSFLDRVTGGEQTDLADDGDTMQE